MSLAGYADIFLRNTLASGVVPQISAIMGPCAGGAVYSPAITDFTLMVEKTCYMFVTGPDVIKTVTHEEVTKEQLGGAMTHNAVSGVAHFLAHDDAECLGMIRELLELHALRTISTTRRRRRQTADPIDRARRRARHASCPPNPTCPTTSRTSFARVVDDGYFFEVHEHYAKNIVVGFARLGGRSVGVVANQPAFLAGVPRHHVFGQRSALRALLRLLQYPAGHLRRRSRLSPRTQQEYGGIITPRRQAALRLCRSHRAQAHGDYPQSLWRSLLRHGLQAHPRRRELCLAHGRNRRHGTRGRGEHRLPPRAGTRRKQTEPRGVRKQKIEEFRDRFANPYIAAERGYVDAVIQPRETRRSLIHALECCETKRDKNPPKKHGNIPL